MCDRQMCERQVCDGLECGRYGSATQLGPKGHCWMPSQHIRSLDQSCMQRCFSPLLRSQAPHLPRTATACVTCAFAHAEHETALVARAQAPRLRVSTQVKDLHPLQALQSLTSVRLVLDAWAPIQEDVHLTWDPALSLLRRLFRSWPHLRRATLFDLQGSLGSPEGGRTGVVCACMCVLCVKTCGACVFVFAYTHARQLGTTGR